MELLDTFWIQSSAQEADAGTLYPSGMVDTNGNSVTIGYMAGLGSLGGSGSSARISGISDSRANGTYTFNYSAGLIPQHLTGITSTIAPAENYSFTYGSTSLMGPFSGGSFGTVSVLSSVMTPGLNTSHQFAYNTSGEMTQATTPLGGTLGWSYRNYTYSGAGATYREVQSRTMSSGTFSGAMSNTWNMTTDTGTLQHATWTVSDVGANSSKVWTFGTSGTSQGLATSYEERGPGGTALNHTDYTWTTDTAGNVYVGTVLGTVNPGANQIQSKSTQTLDTYGNIAHSEVYDIGNLTTPAKTYNFTYVTDSNYTTRYIRNRMTVATVTPAGGSAVTLVTNTYDGYSASPCYTNAALTARTGTWQHDDTNYGTGMTYRGNVLARGR